MCVSNIHVKLIVRVVVITLRIVSLLFLLFTLSITLDPSFITIKPPITVFAIANKLWELQIDPTVLTPRLELDEILTLLSLVAAIVSVASSLWQ